MGEVSLVSQQRPQSLFSKSAIVEKGETLVNCLIDIDLHPVK